MAWGLRVHALLSECGLWAAPSCPRRWAALPTPSSRRLGPSRPRLVCPSAAGGGLAVAEPRGAGCPPSLPLEVTQLKVPWEGLPQGADSPQSHLLARGQEQHPFLGFSGAGCRRPHHPRLPGRVCLGEGTRAVDLPSRRLPGRAEGWPAQNGNSEETGSGSRHRALLPTVLSSAGSLPRPGLRAFAGVGGGGGRKPQPPSPGTSARQLCARWAPGGTLKLATQLPLLVPTRWAPGSAVNVMSLHLVWDGDYFNVWI